MPFGLGGGGKSPRRKKPAPIWERKEGGLSFDEPAPSPAPAPSQGSSGGGGFDAGEVAANLIARRERGQNKKQAVISSLLNSPLPGLDEEQTAVANTVLQVGLEKGATPEELLAAVETGLVESGFKNYTNQEETDADSLGWRQERTSIYGTGADGPTNVRASAERFFDELKGFSGSTPGELAANTQRPAEQYRGRYDEEEEPARDILGEFLERSEKAQDAGISLAEVDVARPQPLKGPYEGSRRFVSSLFGQGVHGDKEPGHAAGGMHDPPNPDAYAQDIGSAYTSGNPAEGEPPYSEETVDKVVRNLRKRGADIPGAKQFSLGENWEGNVDGYDVEFLTEPHGTGPHIHLGAEYTGGSDSSVPSLSGLPTTSAPVSYGGSSSPGSGQLMSAALEKTDPEQGSPGESKLSSVMGLLESPLPSVRDPLQPLKRKHDELLKLAMRGRYT